MAKRDVVKTGPWGRRGRFCLVYLRRCYRVKDDKRHAYWALVKSVRTAKGPRQQVVAYRGDLDEAGRLGVQQAAGGNSVGDGQMSLGIHAGKINDDRLYRALDALLPHKADVTTVQEIVTTREERHGQADRIWVMDRGRVSAANIEFLGEGGRRYIVGTPQSMPRKYEKQWVAADWNAVHEGLASPQKRATQRAMTAVALSHRVGRLRGQNTRAAGAFKTDIGVDAQGHAMLTWTKVESWRTWAGLSEGCHLLRSNVSDWSAADLWRAYRQLTEAENAFRIHKSDLSPRPIGHQKKERVQAPVRVCFLAYVLWKTLGQMCPSAGLGDEPPKVLDEIAAVQTVDVILPTRRGQEIRKRCIPQPTDHQAILLHRLGLSLPRSLEMNPM